MNASEAQSSRRPGMPMIPPIVMQLGCPHSLAELARHGLPEALYERAIALVRPTLQAQRASLLEEAERLADVVTRGGYSLWRERADRGTLPTEPAEDPNEAAYGF